MFLAWALYILEGKSKAPMREEPPFLYESVKDTDQNITRMRKLFYAELQRPTHPPTECNY